MKKKPSSKESIGNPGIQLKKHPVKELPYSTSSICPDCLLDENQVSVIPATVSEHEGKIWLEKSCPSHGDFRDLYWSDSALFKKNMTYWYETVGLENPRTQQIDGCPHDCGQCPNHKAHTALGLIDVTNKCNMQCPVCFAAASENEVLEPTPEEVLKMLKNLRANLPAPTVGIQFAGGEPTLSENLLDYVKWANDLGFRHIMLASNGIRISKDASYLQKLVDKGLKTLYLQFDGVSEKPYLKLRGSDLREMKNRVLDHARLANLDGVILVPTIAKGINDNELGGIIQYALDNRDIVRCVNFQPISITGRIDTKDRERLRITTPDALKLIEKHTNGSVRVEDWYPVSSMMGVGRVLGLLRGTNIFELHSHFACGMATFLFINEDGSFHPITDVVDLEALLVTLEEICDIYASGQTFASLRTKMKLLSFIRKVKRKHFMKPIISSFLQKGNYSSLRHFMSRVIMLGVMHFQDPWNLDLERVQHCTINYALPDGRIVPFCTYNIIHRNNVQNYTLKLAE